MHVTQKLEIRAARLREERRLFERYAQHRRPRDRERLVELHRPLAQHLARRYAGGEEPFDDLLQVAYVGLIKSIDRYDLGQGTAFSSFALPTILGELRRHFRDRTWCVRVPRGPQELSLRIERVSGGLAGRLGRWPSAGELSAHLDVPKDDVVEALAVARAHRAAPLEFPDEDDDGGGGGPAIPGVLDDGFAQAEHRVMLTSLLHALAPQEQEILRLRYAEDLTQSEIAGRVGSSQMHVSRVLRRSLERLREAAQVEARPAA